MNIVDMKGKKVKSLSLSKDLFGDDLINEGLIHEYVVMYLANQRQSTANTKTRGQVKRSGRKLYRQKGSGRARVGDAGSPIRRGGGVVFGPTSIRNWSKDMPAKMKRIALCGAISLKAKGDKLLGLKEYTSDTAKTKEVATMLQSIGIKNNKVLLVLSDTHEVLQTSCNNIPSVSYTTAGKLNAYDVMSTKHIVFIADAYDLLEQRLTK